MKIMLDEGAFMPTRAHPTDAGLDLRAKERVKIWPGMTAAIDTGVHIELPKGYYGKIESKSGLNVKHDIVSCGGTIDEPYRGSIVVKLYNFGQPAPAEGSSLRRSFPAADPCRCPGYGTALPPPPGHS